MEMCSDGALVMPSNYAVMSEDEMTYVEGGSVSLKMKTDYLKKSNCKSKAKSLKKNNKVKDMSETAIAQEIYAHAKMFFSAALCKKLGVDVGIINEVIDHAGVIDIDDGGDTAARRAVYTLIWYGNI